MEIEALNSDQHRAELEAFLAANISEDAGRVPVLPRANDPHRGHRVHLLAAREGGDIVAGLFAAPPVLEVAEMSMSMKAPPKDAGVAALADFVMLYAIAIDNKQRRKGLGARLLSDLHERVAATTAHTVYGVCTADSVGFYRAQGYAVQERNESLHVAWGTAPMRFGIEGDAQWFMRRV